MALIFELNKRIKFICFKIRLFNYHCTQKYLTKHHKMANWYDKFNLLQIAGFTFHFLIYLQYQ